MKEKQIEYSSTRIFLKMIAIIYFILFLTIFINTENLMEDGEKKNIFKKKKFKKKKKKRKKKRNFYLKRKEKAKN